MTPPIRPWVQKLFDPFRHQHCPCFTAVVRMPAASLPAPASVRPHAPSISPRASGPSHRSFCASVPNMLMCAEQSPLCAATDSAIDGSTRASSSMQMQ